MVLNPLITIKTFFKKYIFLIIFTLGLFTAFLFKVMLDYTSSNDFCNSCHVHPQANVSWKLSTHFDNQSGVIVNCVECHLPPKGVAYVKAKVITGLRDIYGTVLKEQSEFNWDIKSTREFASRHVYKASCLDCHANLFPRQLTQKGEDAHLYYERKSEQLRCINCHLEVGHFHKQPTQSIVEITSSQEKDTVYQQPALVSSFKNFSEQIPNSSVKFEMITIPGGTFLMGSPENETYRSEDEGPQRTVEISQFWLGKCEVSWDEYDTFYEETKSEGRTDTQIMASKNNQIVDAITGPTPFYGNPDQGWGRGKRPAITMTHFAAKRYCEWLSLKTGKKYRLPTEAEWEYACRANTKGAYFFAGEPEKYSRERFINQIFGVDTSTINSHIIYSENSFGRSQVPTSVKPNPFGLVHMLGNVREFCADRYDPEIYTSDIHVNPKGPNSGEQFVVRGGSFKSDASDVRIAARDFTKPDAWLLTDPQMPKSIWWYSDCNDVGFRVVCEYNID